MAAAGEGACKRAVAYNVVTGQDHLNASEADRQLKGTEHLFGPLRRKFPERADPGRARSCFQFPVDRRSREDQAAKRRRDVHAAQLEASGFAAFQARSPSFAAPCPAKTYKIGNRKYANEVERLRASRTADRGPWLERRGEPLVRSISAPSLDVTDPAGSLGRAQAQDARKAATQHMTESAAFAPISAASSYSMSMSGTAGGRRLDGELRHCSVNRLENGDFAVARKNNHYSSQDKLTRSDPFFMPPRGSISNSSVKYDIVSNEKRWFRY